MGRSLQLGLVTVGILALGSALGCQPDNTTSAANNAGTAGSNTGATGGTDAGASGSNTGGTDAGAAGSNTGGSGAGTAGTGGSSTGGSAGSSGDPCTDGAESATIYDVTKGVVGQNLKVKIDGVIAMSPKILISHSKSSGNCLWGVFVSAPKTEGGQQLLETAANSGIIVLSSGNPIDISMPCPTGTDAIPDDVAPGDVLDIVAKTDSFLPDFVPNNPCGTKATDSDIPTLQLSDACQAKRQPNKAAVPTPHEFGPDELAAMAGQHKADPGAEAFHTAWGGVKVKVKEWSPHIWPANGANPETVAGPFGIVRIAPHDAEIHDGLYYENKSMELCETGPKWADLNVKFEFVQGFHYLDYCTWSISNLDKCADFSPQSDDCAAQMVDACIK